MKEIELILILCQYYFDGEKGIERFATRFNQYFRKDVSTQTILFSISKFKSVDPANNENVKDEEYVRLWKEYITDNKIPVLKDLYRCFKKGKYVTPLEKLVDEPIVPENIIGTSLTTIVNDSPHPRPENYATKGVDAYKRSRNVAANALALADFSCELGCTTELFIRKATTVTYTEAHHLIPLCFQNEFLNSLDVEANIVSLCPNCHRKLHYGAEIEPMLEKLYMNRHNRLKKCGIEISYEKLLLLYR